MLLEAIDISKKYGNETVLNDVSLGIEAGESLAVTGPSGSGKSTLLSLLGLLLQSTGGEVLFKGRKVSELSDDARSQLRNRSFGFIFQNSQLIGSLSVLDNVLVPALLARQRGLEPKAEKLLSDLGLKSRLSYLPYQLSIGQKRRVAVARALLLDPMVVFADEPTNDLDPERAAWIGEYLLELPKAGRSLILATHDVRLASKAGRAVQLVEGRVRALPIDELKAG